MNHDTNNRYTYSAFGLIISSEVELPGFVTCRQSADVHITFGKTPEMIVKANVKNSRPQFSDNEFLLVKNNIRYYIKDGQQVVIELCKNVNNDELNSYLTGICMAVILFQRGAVPLHGSSVVIDGKGVIFTGPSGAGKSSLCYAYRKNNHRFLSDEISVVSLDGNGHVIIQPGSPQQRLRRGVITRDDLQFSELSKSYDQKYLLCSELNFEEKPVPLAAVFEIKKMKSRQVFSTKIMGTEKLRCFINNLYCATVLTSMGISQNYFLKCSEIADKLDYYHLIRPKKGDTIQEQMHVVDTIVTDTDIT